MFGIVQTPTRLTPILGDPQGIPRAASPERKKHPGADFGPGAFVLDTLGLTAGKLTLDPAAPVAMPEASAETRDVTVKFSPPLP